MSLPPRRFLGGPAVVGLSVVAVFAAVTVFFKFQQFSALNTQLYDLGESANVLWNTFHGRPFWSSVMGENYLGQHFAPALALLGPFLLFGDTAFPLIVAQCLAIAAAVPCVYGMGARVTGRRGAGVFLAALYVLSPHVHEVIRVDFHEVGLGLPLTLAALAAWESGRRRAFAAAVAAALLLREDYGLYLAGFAVSLWATRAASRRFSLALAGGGAAWSCLLIFLVMPAIAGGVWKPAAFAFGPETGSGGSLVKHFLSPSVWAAFASDPERGGAVGKLLLTFGALPLLSPGRAWAWGLPLLLNALGQNPWQREFELHYSATVLPYLFWASAHGLRVILARIPSGGAFRFVAGGAAAALVVVSAIRIPKYYAATTPARREAARRLVRRIPPGDSVMAQTNLLPHVCRRRDVTLVPGRGPARWILLDMVMARQGVPALWESQRRFVESHRDWIVDAGEGLILLSPPASRTSDARGSSDPRAAAAP